MAITGTTPVQSLPVPLGTDAPPDGPEAFMTFGSAVETMVNMVFDDTADRTAKVTSPTEGMQSYLKDVNRVDIYDGTAWVPFRYVTTPRCHAYVSAAQNISPTGDWDLVRFDQDTGDTHAMHDNVTNNSRVVAKVAGLYQVSACVFFAANSTGSRMLHLRKNSGGSSSGGSYLAQDRSPTVTTSGVSTPLSISFDAQLALNDYIEMFAWQNSGGDLALLTDSAFHCFLQMRWVSG